MRFILGVPLLSLALAGCGNPFTAGNIVDSVRILAIQADEPYPVEGHTVHLTALAVDGRSGSSFGKIPVYWWPVACINPPNGSYFACYTPFAGDSSFPSFPGLSEYPPGIDLTTKLTAGTRFSFSVPPDLFSSKSSPSYVVIFAFAIACDGHVEFVEQTQDTVPPAPPLGCFDDKGKVLGPDDSVFAYAQMFSFKDGHTNQNPEITGLTYGVGGPAVDLTTGITVKPCTAKGSCPANALGATLTPVPSTTNTTKEVWVDYFVTAGTVDATALLYDPGLTVTSSTVQLTPPTPAPAPPPKGTVNQFLWAVVHDNEGGVNWLQGTTAGVPPGAVPLTLQ